MHMFAVVTLDRRGGITYVPVARPVGFWTVLTMVVLASVHAYVRGPNEQPVVTKLMLPVQAATAALVIARVQFGLHITSYRS